MKRLFTLTVFLISCAFSAWAQHRPDGSMDCGTNKAWKRLIQQDPTVLARHRALNEWTRAYLNAPTARQVQDDDSVLVIPVVVHVIHNFGAENIPDAQVEDFIRIINEDFNKRAADTGRVSALFKPLHGRVRFEFRLARLDPNGNCTIGITRTISPLTMEGDDRVKDLVRWPNDKYMNVWVVNTIDFAGAYAYYPGAGPDIDGIVCRFTQFGSIGGSFGGNFSSRTMTHEIGHYFNLAHTWGDSNEPGDPSNCAEDDDVTDTPNTVGTSNQGCDLNMHTCGEAMPDNAENYMDYSNCGRMFTLGQKARMRAAAYGNASDRNNLWSMANLIATGTQVPAAMPVCAPSITVPAYSYKICPNQEVRFVASLNASTVSQTNFVWEFPGSNTPISTQPYPRVTYITPGVYPIRLKVFNAAGADSVVQDSSIVVRNPTPAYAPGDSETFSTANFPVVAPAGDQFWEVEGENGMRGWSRSLSAGAADNASLRCDIRPLVMDSKYSALSPAFDLTNVPRPAYLVYKYAAAQRFPGARDEFAVYVSNNCGMNWNVKARRTAFSTPNVYTRTAAVTGPYTPAQGDFVEQRINIDPYIGSRNVRFKFETKVGGAGNAIYLDDIKIISLPTAVGEKALLQDVEIAPNPSSTLVEVGLPSWPQTKAVRYELVSPLGQRVMAGRSEGNQFTLDVSKLAVGIYMLQLEGQQAQRIVVE